MTVEELRAECDAMIAQGFGKCIVVVSDYDDEKAAPIEDCWTNGKFDTSTQQFTGTRNKSLTNAVSLFYEQGAE